jgi:hypothetical protein
MELASTMFLGLAADVVKISGKNEGYRFGQ